ncbi:DNA polymerase/3'-5' exonuclease PolX [Virgibacillus phasianinus]|uniref:DNA-directed DNA polymerase n=1 Tax=Virgibacillus phasianinus TaxID=2017483 RepID=A0A220U5A6_9BACI|nr:DNA polymerase/3'-5' exonuclease PolX [Virgibacillus phasianinus]ASK63021.1 DNA polymerase/3'-5' exonuclease PolX [Virgibacillus phasianinus]
MDINKKDVLKLLEKVAVYLELKGENSFKVSAYRKAAMALEQDDRSLSEIDDFTKIKGIGKGTAAVITEYIEDGKSDTLAQLEREVPRGLVPLLNLPGLGGKKLAKLYQELGVTDAITLQKACQAGEVEKLAGFGKKTAEKILQALEDANSRPERLPIAMMLPVAERIEAYLSTITEIETFSRAGSLRRMRETVKDIDFIIATNKPTKVRDALLGLETIKEVIAKGDTKVSVTLEEVYDINVDFRIVEPQEFATTLHHFTGSKEHNVAMRQLAKKRHEKINEYGITLNENDETLTFENETQFFQHFGLPYIPPEIRENQGEIESYTDNISLLKLSDIRGDLHMHTTWSDGAQSLEEMVNQARKIGYDYLAITDHSKFLRVANGLNEDKLRRQRKEIERVNEKYRDIHVFAGVEMDILPDGSLDFDNDFLKEMDFVIGAIHSSFNQSEEKIMKRLEHAMENPYVTFIAHPTGRLIGRRSGYSVDMERLIQRAKETNTALEINANPNRLDISAQWARKAQEQGVKIVIDTDAHSYQMLEHMKHGVGIARKGWIEKDNVLNTWTKDKLIKFMNQKR